MRINLYYLGSGLRLHVRNLTNTVTEGGNLNRNHGKLLEKQHWVIIYGEH